HEIRSGQHVVLSGKVSGLPSAASHVRLYRRTYPVHRETLVAAAEPAGNGSFSFVRSPRQDASYEVRVGHGLATRPVAVDVDARAAIRTRAITPGRAAVRIRLPHP